MDQKKFRVGLVGAGYIAPFHVAALKRLHSATIVGVCDKEKSRADQLAREYDIPNSHESLRELLERDVNVVHILTPPHTHAPLAIEALHKGCHVVVEKPLATSVDECKQIQAAAAVHGAKVCVNHSNLLDPFTRKAIDSAIKGAIGDIISVYYQRSSTYPPYLGGLTPPQYRTGGYPFRDMGVHGLYVVQKLLGEIQNVTASFRTKGGDPNLLYDEWIATAICEKGLGTLRMSWNVTPLQNQLIIEGTKGIIRADMFSMFVTKRTKSRLPASIERILSPIGEAFSISLQVPLNVAKHLTGRIRRYHGLQATVAAFYASLENNTPVPVSIEEAMPVVKWTEHIAQQADKAKVDVQVKHESANRADTVVTGASGFIGKYLTSRLLERGERIRILTRRPACEEWLNDDRIETVLGDLGDPIAVGRALQNAKTVYHLGAATKGPSHDFIRGTVVGTKNIVDAALKNGVEQLLYISSMSVLQSSLADENSFIREDWPLEPSPGLRGLYTETKLEAEQLVSSAVRKLGLHAVIIRPGLVFGPGASLLNPSIARQVGNRLIIIGDGTIPLPLIYVEDLIDSILAAYDRKITDGTIFHIADPTNLTQNQIAERICNESATPLTIHHIPRAAIFALADTVETAFKFFRRAAPLNRYRLKSALAALRTDCTQAKRALNWEPRVGTLAGLDKYFFERSRADHSASGLPAEAVKISKLVSAGYLPASELAEAERKPG